MSSTTTRAVARLVAASTFLCALPALAQGDLTVGPGASPRADFLDGFGVTALNGVSLVGGSTLDFGALGTAALDGGRVWANSIVDVGGDGTYTLTFSQLLDGFGADFSQASGGLSLTLLNGGSAVGTFSTTLANNGVSFLGVSGIAFDAVRVTGDAGLRLRMDNVVVGAQAAVSAVPEPGTLALLGIGLAGTALAARRRRALAAATA